MKLSEKQQRICEMLKNGYELFFSLTEDMYIIAQGRYMEGVREATVDTLVKSGKIAPANFKHGCRYAGYYKLVEKKEAAHVQMELFEDEQR